MKFTKEEAFESLKGILTNGGKKTLRMSEKSINKQLESLMPLIANEDMELADFVGKVKETFSVMNSNAEKDNSDFVKQWEKDHAQVNSEQPKTETQQPNDVIAAMLKRIEELENREAARTKESNIAQKRTDLLKAMRQKGIKDEQWARDFIEEISLNEDTDVTAKAESFLKLYNKSQAATFGNGEATPKDTSGNVVNKDAHRFDYLKKEYEREQERSKNVI